MQSLAPLPPGSVIVAGKDDDRTWLARISSDGKVVWEHFLGLGKGSAITTVQGKVVLATFEAHGDYDNRTYHEDVAISTFDGAGKLLGHWTVREAINTDRAKSLGDLAVASRGDAIYVLSSWPDTFMAKALEVLKLDIHGTIAWRKELSETVSATANGWIGSCRPDMAVLSNDDLLVACSTLQDVSLFQMKSQSGDAARTSAPLPDCDEGKAAALFLVPRTSGDVWIFGSRPEVSYMSRSCTWLGQMPLSAN